MRSLKDRENIQSILERKVDSAVRGEFMAQQKICDEAEAEVEARNWDMLFERSIKNLNLSDFSLEKN